MSHQPYYVGTLKRIKKHNISIMTNESSVSIYHAMKANCSRQYVDRDK